MGQETRKRRKKKGVNWTTVILKYFLMIFFITFGIFLLIQTYLDIKDRLNPIPSDKVALPQQVADINSSSEVGALINYFNQTGGIPIKVTSSIQTNWSQYVLSLFFGSIFLLWVFGDFLRVSIKKAMMKSYFRALSGKTKRHVLFIKHTEQGLFSGSMIDQNTLSKIQKALMKFNGEPFDLILHTPGGEIFAAMFISRLLKEYPAKIRTWIPAYAMSGGTLLALSTDEIYMSPTACIGPVDPQLGSLFRYGSAASWDKIVKYKGKKAEDQSISFALMGEQYTKSIKNHLINTIHLNMNPKDKLKFVDFITSGKVEHAFALTVGDLKKMGVPVKIMEDKGILIKLIKFITSKGTDGVTYA